MVLTTFPFLQFLHNADFSIKKQESCSNHWWEPFFHHPKVTKIHNNKIFMFDATDVFAREVSQKSIVALPCCMGSSSFFSSHAAWECDFCFLQHLSSEKTIFSFFQHIPSENHQNEKNRTSKPCCGGVSAEGATSKIGSKSASCPGIYDRDTFFNFTRKLTNRFNNVCNPPEYK